MTDSRNVRLASRWTSRDRLIATLLLSLLPAQTLPAAAAPQAASRATPARIASGAAASVDVTLRELPLFGPRKYVRTTGPKNVYVDSLNVPGWLVSPFRLRVENGAPDGTRRVSSSTVEINGTAVITESDLNQTVTALDREVTLTPANELRVTLASVPTSYLTIGLFGTSADYTPPLLTWAQPAAGGVINTATPRLAVKYHDAVGAEEPAASGVDLASLRVFVDDVDRSALFTRRSDEASATIPQESPLAEGVHTFRATVDDLARNRREVNGEFRVDLTPPAIAISAPAGGAYVPTTRPPLVLSYQDEVALNLASLSVSVNGVDLTPHFTRGANEASIVWPAGVSLSEGPNQVVATIRDAGGNESTASLQFNVDTTPPRLTIAHPVEGTRFGSGDVALKLTWADEQGVDASTATATVGTVAVALTPDGDAASGQMTGLADGTHTVVAAVSDRAGNTTDATASFIVDTTVPAIAVVQPPPGANINDNTPDVALTYSDEQGVDTATLKVEINDVDRTTLFTAGSDGAAASIDGFTLPDGVNRVVAEIRDVTSNLGRAISSFFVDTVAPTGAIDMPGELANSSTPAISVHYADSGSGIDPSSVRLVVDGTLHPDVLSAGPANATGTLPLLADGPHHIAVTFADRAGNSVTVESDVVIDTRAPELAIVVPADESFTNSTTPALRVTYSDPLGTGADPATLALTLRKGSDAPVDVTSYVTPASNEAIGIVPDAARLADGTYTLRAEVRDRAGNTAVVESYFEVDTVAPEYHIDNPPADGYVNTPRPELTIEWSDGLSGVDVTRTIVLIDGADRTARFAMSDSGATGTLIESDALADGRHTILLQIYDRAGNAAPAVVHNFTVDTIEPTIEVEAPLSASYVGIVPYAFAVAYDDSNGSGIDPRSVRVLIDDVDYSASFVADPARATAEITTAIADGAHTMSVSVLDWAGNPATAQSSFTVDATAPTISISEPAANAWLKGPAITVTGTTADASPLVVEVNGIVAATTAGTFTATVPADDGTFTITAVARDAAANEASAKVTVRVDSAPPVITVTEPLDGLATQAGEVVLAGSISDVSPVTLTLDGEPLALSSNAFSITIPLPSDGPRTMTLVATDSAGNSSTLTRTVTRDTVAPSVTIASPAESSVVGALPVVLRGTVQDATAVTMTVDGTPADVTGGVWEASVGGLADGARTLAVTAVDAAGNTTTVTRQLTIDTAAPRLSIASPVSGSLTREATTTITGTASDLTLQSVTAEGITAVLEAGAGEDEKSFTIAAVPLADGDNSLRVVATDALARTTEQNVLVTRDSAPPVIELDAPSLIARTRGARVTATVTDNLEVRDVVFSLDETPLATLTAAPYAVDVAVPESAQPGDTLSLTVVATDTAGNATTVTKELRVAAEGAVTGQVVSDVTGLPIASARVRVAGAADATLTDERGRYALPANDQALVLVIEGPFGADPPTSTVERNVAVQSGVGTVPVDARLTPLSAPQYLGVTGGNLQQQNVFVAIPAGTVSASTPMRLTQLSPQGLPNLLPLGWSPVLAFDIAIDGEVDSGAIFDVEVDHLPSFVHVAAYNPSLHAWVMIAPGVTAAGGIATFRAPGPGAYAVVVADSLSVAAAVGEPLPGLDMVPIPDDATSSGAVTPPTLPPTGGEAVGRLVIHSPSPLPSGTVVQAEVSESFSLSDGSVASTERRLQDIVLYRENGSIAAEFPIVPSRVFASGELTEGKVHLDILAGREAVRGKTGGQQPLILNAGAVTVAVPAGALSRDLAIAATPVVLSSFLPSTPAAVAIAEVLLDFGGAILDVPAELSVSAENVSATETVVLARVVRIDGVPHVTAVARTERVGDRFVTRQLGSIDALRHDGRYVFYRIGVPWGLVAGSAGFGASGQPAVVRVDGLPFVAIARNSAFEMIAPAGTARVTAFVPGTSLTGEATVAVTAGGTASLNVGLAPTLTTAAVTPANGSIRVPVSTQIEIAATAPIGASSVNDATVLLTDASGVAVPRRFVLSGTGRVLAIVPLSALAPGQKYSVAANGLRDIYGGTISVASSSFTTRPDEPPAYDTNKITFTTPDADGMVTVSAPPGSLPPGTRVLIVNAGNAVVVSYTVGNDGSFSGQFPASISDRLLVTITDPSGNVVNFERSKFVFTDGSGRVAIGAGGGEVEGSGGTAIRIPAGALPSGAVFKVDYFGPEKFPERPTSFPEANFGGGLTITSEQMPKLKEEGKLVFPKPADAPDGAFYYVFRRITGPEGRVAFETVDHAFPEGDKIVTASYPYIGWDDSVGAWDAASTAIGFGLSSQINFFMMWSFDASIPGVPLPGMIIGKAYEVTYEPGKPDPVYKPVANASISAVDESGMSLWARPRESSGILARSQSDGTFSLWDPKYTGGPVQIEAEYQGNKVVTTAYQANPTDSKTFFSTIFVHFRNVANVNVTFPGRSTPASPEVEVHIMRLTHDLQRVDVNGIAVADTPLLIGFKFRTGVQAAVLSATVGSEELQVKRDDGAVGRGMPMDYILVNPWMPNGAGTYTVRTTLLNPLGGPPLEVEHTFLVVAGSGDNGLTINGAAPDWITKRLVPKPNEVGVPLAVLPQVVFTEPVVNVVAGTQLLRDGSAAAFAISGAAVGSDGLPYAIADLRSAPADTPVTSITIQPIGGLDFGSTYTVKLTSAIHDLDTDAIGNPDPRTFPGRELTFTTINPEAIGGSQEIFESRGVVTVGDHAWAIRNDPGAMNGFAVGYKLDGSDTMTEAGRVGVSGKAIAITGETDAQMNEGYPAIVVGSGVKIIVPGPSNVYLFDVRDASQPKRLAAVSVTESAEDGTVLQVHMRKRFVYAVRSFPQAVQVIDLQLAKDIYKRHEESPYQRLQMNKALVTAGVGFAQEAIVNTIRMNPPDGRHTHLLDLQANEYIVNGANKTLVYATGTLPMVIIDPTAPAPITYNGAPPTAQGLLQFGHALALARIGNRDLAVVVGKGIAREDGTGALSASGAQGLFVFDLADPLVPNLIGSYVMSATPTDVVISKGTALVATPEGTWGFSLADATRPRFLGRIAGTGRDLAITEDGGLLISSGASDTRDGGVHVASFHPALIIEPVEPLKVRVAGGNGTVDAPKEVEDYAGRQVRIKVRPRVTVSAGELSIANPRFTAPDGTARDIFPDNYPITWTSDGYGTVTLPAGRRYEDTYLRAIATAETSVGTLTSLPSRIKLGHVKITLDSNNNTLIDERDDEAKRKGRAFAFWESHPKYEFARLLSGRSKLSGGDDDLKGLADYATIRITVNKALTQNTIVRMRLEHDGTPALWYIVPKQGVQHDYLSDGDKARAQKDLIVGGVIDGAVPPCASTATRFAGDGFECGGANPIRIPYELTVGTYDFLFRCRSCNRTSRTNPGATSELILEYLEPGAPDYVTIDRAAVDIRPFNQWMTVMSAREPSGLIFKPISQMREPEPAVPAAEWANAAWPSATHIPPKAKNVTLLVHGYNVSAEAAAEEFFPAYLKRLYWTGHPVLRRQGEWTQPDDGPGCVRDCAHVIGISWPSNDSGESTAEQLVASLADAIKEQYTGLRFPYDEYHAFGTGPALAKYLKSVRDERSDRYVTAIAHSLGNLAFNAALSQLDVLYGSSAGIVDKYVMNQAALPAEAMTSAYAPSTDELTLWGDRHAATYGHPDDAFWIDEWSRFAPDLMAPWFTMVDTMRRQAPGLTIDAEQMYTYRWRQTRPHPLPDFDPVVASNRGPWKGIFEENARRTRTFNTYSENDRIVGVVWRANQRLMKPLSVSGSLYDAAFRELASQATSKIVRKVLGIPEVEGWWENVKLALAEKATIERIIPSIPDWQVLDNRGMLTWGLTEWTAPAQATVFGDGASHWTALRQWAELSFWFPSTSVGAGVKDLDSILTQAGGGRCRVDQCNTNFTRYSGIGETYNPPPAYSSPIAATLHDVLLNAKTHGFLGYSRFSEVWNAYREVKKILDEKN